MTCLLLATFVGLSIYRGFQSEKMRSNLTIVATCSKLQKQLILKDFST